MPSSLTLIVWSLITVSRLYQGCDAQCSTKSPGSGITQSDFEGKFYLIVLQQAYSFQAAEVHCGTALAIAPETSPFKYIISYESPNGTTGSATFTVTFDTPGIENATATLNGETVFIPAVILGVTSTTSAHVIYACDPQNNQPAVWVYYKQRVNGLSGMDSSSQQEVNTILSNNNIAMSSLQQVDNSNCSN